eukprot:8685467-Alexandrium_andersonii.AAC.1
MHSLEGASGELQKGRRRSSRGADAGSQASMARVLNQLGSGAERCSRRPSPARDARQDPQVVPGLPKGGDAPLAPSGRAALRGPIFCARPRCHEHRV